MKGGTNKTKKLGFQFKLHYICKSCSTKKIPTDLCASRVVSMCIISTGWWRTSCLPAIVELTIIRVLIQQIESWIPILENNRALWVILEHRAEEIGHLCQPPFSFSAGHRYTLGFRFHCHFFKLCVLAGIGYCLERIFGKAPIKAQPSAIAMIICLCATTFTSLHSAASVYQQGRDKRISSKVHSKSNIG